MKKDVYILFETVSGKDDQLDVLPRSIYTWAELGRILWVTKSCDLSIFDVVENKIIRQLNVGSQMPLKRYDILDTAFDSRLGRYYILNEGWILEVWDLLDEQKVTPMARIRFFAEKIDT